MQQVVSRMLLKEARSLAEKNHPGLEKSKEGSKFYMNIDEGGEGNL